MPKYKKCSLCRRFLPVVKFRLTTEGKCMPWCQDCTRKYDSIMKKLKKKKHAR